MMTLNPTADKLSPHEARAKIIDEMKGAIRDLAGMVPNDQRHISDDYVKILEHCMIAAREAFEVLTKMEAALTWADRGIKRQYEETQHL